MTHESATDRRAQILVIAARLFARKGYRGTSMREIGAEAGVLGGSLYHHIRSKDALFVELHEAALHSAAERIARAIALHHDPWQRLHAACRTLLEVQLAPDSLTTPLMNDLREVPDAVRLELIAQRDDFEEVFKRLVEALPLPARFERSLYRILLLTQLNFASSWYSVGELTPSEIAEQIVSLFRHER